jgi:hypothetical protein
MALGYRTRLRLKWFFLNVKTRFFSPLDYSPLPPKFPDLPPLGVIIVGRRWILVTRTGRTGRFGLYQWRRGGRCEGRSGWRGPWTPVGAGANARLRGDHIRLNVRFGHKGFSRSATNAATAAAAVGIATSTTSTMPGSCEWSCTSWMEPVSQYRVNNDEE